MQTVILLIDNSSSISEDHFLTSITFYVLDLSGSLNVMMETKGGKKSSSKSQFYEAPLGYGIEDVRPNGGIKKFRSAAYSNVCLMYLFGHLEFLSYHFVSHHDCLFHSFVQCVRKPS